MQVISNLHQYVVDLLYNEQDEETDKQAKHKCTELAKEEVSNYQCACNVGSIN